MSNALEKIEDNSIVLRGEAVEIDSGHWCAIYFGRRALSGRYFPGQSPASQVAAIRLNNGLAGIATIARVVDAVPVRAPEKDLVGTSCERSGRLPSDKSAP